MEIIDLHSDLITDIAFRRKKGERNVFANYHLEALKNSHVTGLICNLWVEPFYQQDALNRLHQLLTFAFEDFTECADVKIVKTFQDIEQARKDDQIFIVLGLEGMTFLEDCPGESDEEKIGQAIDELKEKYYIHHAIYVWNEKNILATGSGININAESRGLTNQGIFVSKYMEDNYWMIDVSHLDDTSFWDVVKHTKGPLMASHSNARAVFNHERNLSDEMIQAIADRGGIIGVNAHAAFIDDKEPSLERFVDHIVHIIDLVGIDYVGLGFDFTDYLADYGFGGGIGTTTTAGLENVTKISALVEEMSRRGLSDSAIEKVCSKNALKYLKLFIK